MLRTLFLGSAVLAGPALATACGSSPPAGAPPSAPPLPAAEPLGRFVARFERAAGARDCPGLRALGLTESCPRLVASYGGARATTSLTFRTGAVVALDNGWTLVLAESNRRRWTSVVGARLDHPTADGSARDAAAARDAADRTFAAIVRRDCPAFYRSVYTPGVPPAERRRVCTPAFANIGPVYAQNAGARPVALGGTHRVQFFGYFLRAGRRRYYATVAAVSPGRARGRWATLAPSPVLLGTS